MVTVVDQEPAGHIIQIVLPVWLHNSVIMITERQKLVAYVKRIIAITIQIIITIKQSCNNCHKQNAGKCTNDHEGC